jgi:hypothetical protein
MWHVWVRREVHTGLNSGNLREDYFEDPGVDGRIILKWIFERLDGARTGFSSSINRQLIIILTSRLHICSNLED